ncbi:MAG: hypothetical protein ACK53V_06375, partial [Planctomycetota bacterium]
MFATRATPTQVDQGLLLTLNEGTPQAFQFGWQSGESKVYYRGPNEISTQFASLVRNLHAATAGDSIRSPAARELVSLNRSPMSMAEQVINAYGVGKVSPSSL